MKNPLLNIKQFPDYDNTEAKHAFEAIKKLCDNNKSEIENIINSSKPTWETYEILEELDDNLSKAWSVISNMSSVMNDDEWREAHQQSQQIISDYSAKMSQNKNLYDFYLNLEKGKSFNNFNSTQKKIIQDAIRDFKLSGVNLEEKDKVIYQNLVSELSELKTQFSNNVLDATQSFSILIDDKKQLDGIPNSAIDLYQQLAKQKDKKGYLITLDFPSYFPVISYSNNRDLREKLYLAYATRASEISKEKMFDNTEITEQILIRRQKLAKLLSFENYSEYSVSDKMAESPTEILNFLYDLVDKSKVSGQKDHNELKEFAKNELNINSVEAWDINFIAEKLKESKYSISQEELRQYFPTNKVISGLFSIVNSLFEVSFVENKTYSKWHKDVITYDVFDKDNNNIAHFYMDLYARTGKRGGAWMADAVSKIKNSNKDQKPIAYLTCNFIPPVENSISYLNHDEIVTLFHEFGHTLHHILTKVNYSAASGINGVEWDAVELPSQFMENFCFQEKVLQSMSEHKETKETLPKDLFDKLTASKNFRSASMMLRQLEFSIFDMILHCNYNDDKGKTVMQVLKTVQDKVAVIPTNENSRFPMSFSHIFAGGYSAGYYSYKWAEVLSADAFSLFEEKGIYDKTTGTSFKNEILEKGSSRTALENFIKFRGRKPSVNALLKHNGI